MQLLRNARSIADAAKSDLPSQFHRHDVALDGASDEVKVRHIQGVQKAGLTEELVLIGEKPFHAFSKLICECHRFRIGSNQAVAAPDFGAADAIVTRRHVIER